MTDIEKKDLTEKGLSCLSVLNHLFSADLQGRKFDTALSWYHEYAGALKALAEVELISQEKADLLTDRAFQRYRMAKYPDPNDSRRRADDGE